MHMCTFSKGTAALKYCYYLLLKLIVDDALKQTMYNFNDFYRSKTSHLSLSLSKHIVLYVFIDYISSKS